MGLSNWFRSSGSEKVSSAHLVGMDLDAGRIRAVALRMGRPRRIQLDDPRDELALLISLQKRHPEAGQPALSLLRTFPHLVCRGFLPRLGYPGEEWKAGRVRLDPESATKTVLEQARVSLPSPDALALTLPGYLTQLQVSRVTALCEQAKIRVRGTIVGSLALAADLAATSHEHPRSSRSTSSDEPEDTSGGVLLFPHRGHRDLPTSGSVGMIVDVDDHALTASLIGFARDEVRIIGYFSINGLGLHIWKERLLDCLSDRCVRVCRRDPRDNAETEQALYEQLDDALQRSRHGQQLCVSVRSQSWYQDLPHQPDDFDGYCQSLARKASEATRELGETADEPPRVIWFTDQAAQLPGLVRSVRRACAVRTLTRVLEPDAMAIAGAKMAGRWLTGSLPRVHLDTSVPLEPVDRSHHTSADGPPGEENTPVDPDARKGHDVMGDDDRPRGANVAEGNR